MIYRMMAADLIRFVTIYFIFTMGFSQGGCILLNLVKLTSERVLTVPFLPSWFFFFSLLPDLPVIFRGEQPNVLGN